MWDQKLTLGVFGMFQSIQGVRKKCTKLIEFNVDQ